MGTSIDSNFVCKFELHPRCSRRQPLQHFWSAILHGVRLARLSVNPLCASKLPRYDGTVNTTLLDEAKRLSVDERIQLVTAIWDTVAEDANTASLPVSDSHRLELDRRLKDRQTNPEAESPWSEVADRLRKR